MNSLLVEAGEKWVLPFARIEKIAEATTLAPYAFPLEELSGLLPFDGALIPVWRPREFRRAGSIVVVYHGEEGTAGLHVNQVMGLGRTQCREPAHGETVELDDGQHGRWFAIDELERRHSAALPEE